MKERERKMAHSPKTIFSAGQIDNSFSVHTSKRLTFFVALEERGLKSAPQPTPEMSGWLLKKKRKRMQGKKMQLQLLSCSI